VDRLWEKYRILNSYQYAGNNPMTLYDKGGEFIQAISKESQQSIRESVPEKFRGAIQFNEDGFLQINPLKKIAIGQDLNSNISILSRLAENEHTARVFVTDDFEVKSQESGNIEQTSFSNLDPGGRRLAGLTLFPEKDKWVADVSQRVPLSPNGITYILIRPEQPRGMTKGSTAAHELFSHFRYLLLSKLGKANGARHSLPGEEKNDVDRAGKRAELEADR
ncbi:MAG: hypothetical protein LC116_07620, partial [Bacteroidetes bacterium]|nr:hypothetical protein [Bacteroidota bacterium]